MAHSTDDIQQEIADTQREMDTTRSAMTEKLELLGERVQETVEGAQASVEEMVETVRDTVDTTVAAVQQTVAEAQASVEGIVENVKGTVGETVDAVQRTFDLHHQMEQHPWLLLGGATVVGYLLGRGGSGRTAAVSPVAEPRFASAIPPPAASRESPSRSQPQPETGSRDLGWFPNEMAALKSAAVGAVVSTVWAMVKQALPLSPTSRASARTKQDGQPSERPAQTPAARSSTAINGGAVL